MESTTRKHFNARIITYTLDFSDTRIIAMRFLNGFCKSISFCGHSKNDRCISLIYDVNFMWGKGNRRHMKTLLIDVPLIHDFEITKDTKITINDEACYKHVEALLWDSFREFMEESKK